MVNDAAAIPQHPRLRRGTSLVKMDDGLLILAAVGAVRVPAAASDLLENLLSSADGSRSLTTLLDEVSSARVWTALSFLSLLAERGFLLEGPGRTLRSLPAPAARAPRLAVLGEGALANGVRRGLSDLGIDAHAGRPQAGRPTVVVAGGAWPEVEAAVLAAAPCLAVLPVAGGPLVTSRLGGEGEPCPQCVRLRWIGLATEAEAQRRHLDGEGTVLLDPLHGTPSTSDAARLIASAVADLASARTTAPSVGLVDLESGTVTRTRCEPHPACVRCRTPRPEVGRPEQDRELPLSTLRSRLAPFVGRPTGVAALGDTHPPQAATSDCRRVRLARFAFPDAEGVAGAQTNYTHGSAREPSDAQTIALIEAVERYCGLQLPSGALLASYDELAGTALHPEALPLFSARQYRSPGFRFTPFQPGRPLRWTAALNLTRSERQFIPTAAVFYSYDELLSETSNGVAAHSSWRRAAVRGALEAIERDAFMLHWLHRSTPPRIRSELLSADAATMAAEIAGRGYAVHLRELTTDLGIPVALALGVCPDGTRPALLVGGGADFDLESAVTRALAEVFAASLSVAADWKPGPLLAPSDVTSLDAHHRAYSHPAWLPAAAFLWSDGEPHPAPAACAAPPQTENAEELLQWLVGHLHARGHELLVADLTSPDVVATGLHVVRAVIPGLIPLAVGHAVRLGGPRPAQAPLALGWPSFAGSEAELNDTPHCFP